METVNAEMPKKQKKEIIEPEVVYKEIHGKLLPVKVYPTLPPSDKYDNYTALGINRGSGPQDYTYQNDVRKNLAIEYLVKLFN